MARKVFYSFHYELDHWRVQQVVKIGSLEGSPLLNANAWEQVKRTTGIQKWIDAQLVGRSCTVVLIGSETASRPWVQYEIKKSWNSGKGVVGVHIHNLLDNQNPARSTSKGSNPFSQFLVGQTRLSSIVKAYDPSGLNSKAVYATIENNLATWVEEAVKIRNAYGSSSRIS